RDGASSDGFSKLTTRLEQADKKGLADALKTTFLAKEIEDATPYLLVSLYASGTVSLGAKLMEGLYDALQRERSLDIKEILPLTEYEVCVKRFEEMVLSDPGFANADLSQWGLDDYFSTEDLVVDLRNHQPLALTVFLEWHKKVCHGNAFDVSQAGGKNYVQAYLEAGKNLAEKYHYGGIVVLWDEFGHALEDLIGNAARNAGQEIISLQNFVETTGAPDAGHTLFFGVTHVSFPEYASRTNASETVKDGLEKISGRFNKPFKIELNAAESDGYHLLGMQKTWSDEGRQLLAKEQRAKQNLLEVCNRLPLFQTLSAHLEQVFEDVYPLHPVMAVGLFNLSKLAQANRTALTFFRDNAGDILNSELTDHLLWRKELVRFPKLLHYYEESLKKEAGSDWRRYEQAVANVSGDNAEEVNARKDILSTLLLAKLLGDNFKASEDFLACALYDALPNTAASDALNQHLAWLKAAGVIWKNSANHFWSLAGEGGVDVDALIEKHTKMFSGRSYQSLLDDYPAMQEDLLPTLGVHDLEPSSCGIIRSFAVNVLMPPFAHDSIKLKDPLISAQVFLLLASTQQEVLTAKARVQEMATQNIYFWMPILGIEAQSHIESGTSYHLNDLMCRYLAINEQLRQGNALSEDLRRQLEAKAESNRYAIKKMLQVLFGREGLESAQCQVFKAGSTEAIDCHSWHGFKGYLEREVNSLYAKELPIRAMNMNVLRDEKYTGSSKVVKLVERILEFDENPAYQTDLLGEEKETSEPAGLIDGILGANQLFIQQAGGWNIKSVDDTQGELKEVLKLLHDTFFRKRDNPYAVNELRKKLIAAPYGLPACTLPLFAAVAIRHEVKRLRWGSARNETSFAKNLVEAFTDNSKLTIRLFEFGKKQFAMLFLLGRCLDIERAEEQANEDYAAVCAAKLRELVKTKPDGVKRSNQLSPKAQALVRFIEMPGKSAQDLADFLIELLDVKNALPSEDVAKVLSAIKSIFDDFDKVENAKLFEIKQCWDDVFPMNNAERDTVISCLHDIHTHQANQLIVLLEKARKADDVEPKEIIHKMLGKLFDDCSDSDIGRCTAALEILFDQAAQSAPKIYKQPVVPANSDPGFASTTQSFAKLFPGTVQKVGEPEATESVRLKLNDVLRISGLSKDEVVSLLERLLKEHKV
ncbi:MAG: hypothetical protein RQ733_13700, partial [Methyloprofundus sp.]|nr:hypothetical protein [Methyloprofundus sp.]